MCEACKGNTAVEQEIAFLESLIQRNTEKGAREDDPMLLRARQTLDRLYQERQVENHP